MLFFALTAVFFIFLNLITDIPLKFHAALRAGSLDIRFTLHLFYGLIPLHLFLRLEYLPRGGIRIIMILKNGRTKILNSPDKNRIKKQKHNRSGAKNKIMPE